MALPIVGEYWQHRNKNVYRIVAITNLGTQNEVLYPVTVVYENRLTGSLWSRPAHSWDRSFTRYNVSCESRERA